MHGCVPLIISNRLQPPFHQAIENEVARKDTGFLHVTKSSTLGSTNAE